MIVRISISLGKKMNLLFLPGAAKTDDLKKKSDLGRQQTNKTEGFNK